MKKSILLPLFAISALASSAFAAADYTSNFDMTVSSNGSTTPKDFQTAVLDAGYTSMSGTLTVTSTVTAWSEFKIGQFSDFTFNNVATFKRTSSGSQSVALMYVDVNKTLTFKEVVNVFGSGQRLFVGTVLSGANYIGHANAIFEKGINFTSNINGIGNGDQLLLFACHATFLADTTLTGTTHSEHGSSWIADGCKLTINDTYLRRTEYKRDGVNLCTVSVVAKNGATVNIKDFGTAANIVKGAYMYFDFVGNTSAEKIIIGGPTAATNANSFAYLINSCEQKVVFTGMGTNDTLLSTVDLTSFGDNVLFDNGINIVSFKDLVDNGTILVDTTTNNGYYTYTNTIPEPAEYAGILGALAIAFAFMRRR